MAHAALPLLVGAGLGRDRISRRLMVAGAFAAMLPDADVIGFAMGVPYDSALGHRGFSHSLGAALLIGLLAVLAASWLKAGRIAAFLFVGLAFASHGLADMLTDGGHGVMLFWPFDEARHFAGWRPIEVSPIGIERFLDRGAIAILASEVKFLLLPAALVALALRLFVPRPVDLAARRT